MNQAHRFIGIALTSILAVGPAFAQKVETVDGVRIVHNEKGGLWGKSPKVSLSKVRTLGDIDAVDPNLAFYMPSEIALDTAGNMYVLDTGNHRVQKFSPDGKFLSSVGRQGQGPGDFYYPDSLGIDQRGTLYVGDPNNQRVQVMALDSKENKTIRGPNNSVGKVVLLRSGRLLMGPGRGVMYIGTGGPGRKPELKDEPSKLLKILDLEGRVISEFGLPFDYGDMLLNRMGNEVLFTADAADNAYLVFSYQNRIERYSADQRLLWKADRPLNYSVEPPKDRGKMEQTGNMVSVRMPSMNRSATGAAVDGKGRLWVVTLDRQLKKEEQLNMSVTATMSSGGGRTIGNKAEGNTDLRNTDAYKLEVFDPDGVLLGEIPADSFIDGIFIFGDKLFLLDKLRGTRFTEYKIVG